MYFWGYKHILLCMHTVVKIACLGKLKSPCRQIFCDFGEEFVISDVTGEQPISVIISSVSKVTTLCWLDLALDRDLYFSLSCRTQRVWCPVPMKPDTTLRMVTMLHLERWR